MPPASVMLYRTGRKSWLAHEATKLGQAVQKLERLAQQSGYSKIFLEVKKGHVLTEIEKSTKTKGIDLMMVASKGHRDETGSSLNHLAQAVICNGEGQVFSIHGFGRSLLVRVANA